MFGGAHNVPWEDKFASLEQFVPPWTVQRQVWSDSLTTNHSGISTDVLLFSDINLSLIHHYRVHRHGLPHIVFRKDYLTGLRVFMSQAARSRGEMLSPIPSGPVSTCHARSAELESESPRRTRRARRRMRPVRVLEESVSELPTSTAQDPSDLQGAIVYDCRTPLLPVSVRLEDIGPLPLRRTVVLTSLDAPPREDCMAIGGVSPERVAIPELGVAPLVDPDTDLEDEMSTPEDSMLLSDSSPEGSVFRGFVPRHTGYRRSGVGEGTAQRVCSACHGETYRGPCGGFSSGSVFVSRASYSCSAGRRSRFYVGWQLTA